MSRITRAVSSSSWLWASARCNKPRASMSSHFLCSFASCWRRKSRYRAMRAGSTSSRDEEDVGPENELSPGATCARRVESRASAYTRWRDRRTGASDDLLLLLLLLLLPSSSGPPNSGNQFQSPKLDSTVHFWEGTHQQSAALSRPHRCRAVGNKMKK
ncbi:hypothetical protein L226DRAFT_301883 [Lentinus tigrinus ALCF2SS1-7]|uniref:uncharacterized protein n=1 Tax=Lentinus tigrinus ALCF2SS1-7 TaxID=1328758 RepID=UPI001165D86A|nr:hypothetical protein L226DRAFT_301883 [Lentinus tigrinus ALCF2SS1-7]